MDIKELKCQNCKNWANFSRLRTDIKESDFGECHSKKIFGTDYLSHGKDFKKLDALEVKDEIVITQEYFSTPKELPNEHIITGKNFGCIHFEKGNNLTVEELQKLFIKRNKIRFKK